MKSKTHKASKAGFMALTAVILLASGTLAFSLVALGAAAAYSDAVMRRELRIQAGLNMNACFDSVGLMIVKDYFLTGQVLLPEFGCTAQITRIDTSHFAITTTATLSGVAARDSRTVQIDQL